MISSFPRLFLTFLVGFAVIETAHSTYFYTVSGPNAKCTEKIESRGQCERANAELNACKNCYRTLSSNVCYAQQIGSKVSDPREERSMHKPAGCYCDSDKFVAFNDETRLNVADCSAGEKCICESPINFYAVYLGAHCGKNLIRTVSKCKEAARRIPYLGNGCRNSNVIVNASVDAPDGCYCRSGKLYFNNKNMEEESKISTTRPCTNADGGCLCDAISELEDIMTCMLVNKTSGKSVAVRTGGEECRCCFNNKCVEMDECMAALRNAATVIAFAIGGCCLCCLFGCLVICYCNQNKRQKPSMARAYTASAPTMPSQQGGDGPNAASWVHIKLLSCRTTKYRATKFRFHKAAGNSKQVFTRSTNESTRFVQQPVLQQGFSSSQSSSSLLIPKDSVMATIQL